MTRITLIGYRGCGKSTVAERLSRQLGLPWRDADQVLEARVGCSIAQLVRDRGEPLFREEESQVLADLLAAEPCILATGGGVVLRPHNRDLLRRLARPVIWLTAPADVVRRRLAADPTTADRRPALSGTDPTADPGAEVAATLAEREPLYRECADLVIDAGADAPEQIVERILAWLNVRGHEVRRELPDQKAHA